MLDKNLRYFAFVLAFLAACSNEPKGPTEETFQVLAQQWLDEQTSFCLDLSGESRYVEVDKGIAAEIVSLEEIIRTKPPAIGSGPNLAQRSMEHHQRTFAAGQRKRALQSQLGDGSPLQGRFVRNDDTSPVAVAFRKLAEADPVQVRNVSAMSVLGGDVEEGIVLSAAEPLCPGERIAKIDEWTAPTATPQGTTVRIKMSWTLENPEPWAQTPEFQTLDRFTGGGPYSAVATLLGDGSWKLDVASGMFGF